MFILRKSKNMCSSESRVETDNLVFVREACPHIFENFARLIPYKDGEVFVRAPLNARATGRNR